MGKNYSDPQLQNDVLKLTYEVEDEYSQPKIVISENQKYHPEEISKFILEEVRKLAEGRLNENVNTAVVTIPAYFGSSQREATKDAASLAGFEAVHLINEPTAAALAYLFEKESPPNLERNILVYDFGGGTFDVSIVKGKGKHCQVLAVDGDCHLGGAEIDNLLAEHIRDLARSRIPEFASSYTNKIKVRLSERAEHCKRKLTNFVEYKLNVDDLVPSKGSLELIIPRRTLESLAEPLFTKTITIMENCLKMAKLKKDDIDVVLMVGGSTRIPKVREMVQKYFGDEKVKFTGNPDQEVAKGAIAFASTLDSKTEMTFQDVLSLSLGTDALGNKFSKIVERNTSLPCNKSKLYQTTMDNQQEMHVKVYEGERALASENLLLGEVSINIQTEAPAGCVVVEVEFIVSSEGILTVEATERNTNNKERLVIDINNNKWRIQGDVEREIKKAQARKEDDFKYINHKQKQQQFRKYCNQMELKFEDNETVLKEIDAVRNKVFKLSIHETETLSDHWNTLKDFIASNQ